MDGGESVWHQYSLRVQPCGEHPRCLSSGYASQGYASQGYASQGYASQGYASQGYASQNGTPCEAKTASPTQLAQGGQCRDWLRQTLADQGIGSMIYYPVPLHRQAAYGHLGLGEGCFPVAERAAREVLSLPMFPELELAQQERTVAAIQASLALLVA
ncbi:MAG: hypothetical protein HC824_05085 [Synechococcales cyanobacterium RM1_1_8]|nr:hypothetical protein [Synechococcales cyanobacterium RM1_1_8]